VTDMYSTAIKSAHINRIILNYVLCALLRHAILPGITRACGEGHVGESVSSPKLLNVGYFHEIWCELTLIFRFNSSNAHEN
jgi:hypothetical protein